MPHTVYNAHDVAKATGIAYARPVTGRGWPGWSYAGTEYHEGGWDAMVAATGITEWVRVLDDWFPASVVPLLASCGVRDRHGRKLTAKPGRPCEAVIVSDSWYSPRCARPATTTRPNIGMWSRMDEVPCCAMHANVADRRKANTERIRRQVREASETARRRADALDAAAEVLTWAGPLLADLGIHPATLTPGTAGDRGGVLVPAETVATLVELLTGEHYVRPSHDPEA